KTRKSLQVILSYRLRTEDWRLRTAKTNPIQTQIDVAGTPNPKQRSALEGFTYVPKGTVILDKLGALWAHFGVLLDNFGVIWEQFGVILD
ncbi:MAG: hypothetical protein ACYSU8_04915, partial [Planctomycetota bacterium]